MSEHQSHHSHGHHHHHRHSHSRHHRKRQALIWAVVLGVCIIAAVGLMLMGRELDSQTGEEAYGDLEARFAPSVTLDWDGVRYGYRDGKITNILLIGIDQRDMAEKKEGIFSGGQADFLLLLSIDRERKRITPIQLDRDTMATFKVRGVIRTSFLCTAQVIGSTRDENCRNTVSAVSQLLNGIPIDYYLAMDMEGISDLNDALNGVTVTVPNDMSYLDPVFVPGAVVTLQGEQTELFVRSRKYLRDDPTNEARMARQRIFMLAAAERFTTQAQKDLDFAAGFLDRINPHVVTNIPRSWLLNQLQSYLRYDRKPIAVPVGQRRIGAQGYMEFYPDEKALTELVIETFFDRRGRL